MFLPIPPMHPANSQRFSYIGGNTHFNDIIFSKNLLLISKFIFLYFVFFSRSYLETSSNVFYLIISATFK